MKLHRTLGVIFSSVILSLAVIATAQATPTPTLSSPTLASGYRVDWAQVDTAPHSVADAINALNGTGGFNVLDRATQFMPYVNIQDAGVPFAGVDPMFAVRVSGFITLGAGNYSFLSFHDDGIRINVGGETVVLFDADTPNRGDDSPFYSLPAGIYEYEAISWEQGGAFNLQLGIDNSSGRFYLEGSHDVPEPTGLALVALGLIGVGVSRRRRTLPT